MMAAGLGNFAGVPFKASARKPEWVYDGSASMDAGENGVGWR